MTRQTRTTTIDHNFSRLLTLVVAMSIIGMLFVSCDAFQKNTDEPIQNLPADTLTQSLSTPIVPSSTLPPTETPTPSQTPTASQTPTPTQTPTATLTPTPTATLLLPVSIGTQIPRSSSVISVENIVNTQELAVWGQGNIGYTLSPDRTILAATTSTGTCLYDTQTKLQIRCLPPLAAFSPDGNTLITTEKVSCEEWGFCNVLRLFSVHDGQLITSIDTKSFYTFLISFSPDGQSFLVFEPDHVIVLYNSSNGSLIRNLGNAHSVAISPNNELIALVFDEKLTIMSSSDGSIIQEFNLFDARNRISGSYYGKTIEFSPDSRFLAILCQDNVVRVFDLVENRLVQAVNGSEVLFSPDGKTLAIQPDANNVNIWELSDDASRYVQTSVTLAGYFYSYGYSPGFSPDGKTIALVQEEELHFYRVEDGQQLGTMPVSSTGLVYWAPSNIDESYTLEIFEVDGFDLKIAWPEEAIISLSFSPDGKYLAGGTKNSVYVWDASNGDLVYTYDEAGWAFNLDWSANGQYLAALNFIWRMSDGAIEFVGSRGYAIAFSPIDNTIAFSCDYDICIMPNFGEFTRIRLKGHTGQIHDLDFSPDGKLLASISADGTLRVWNVLDGIQLVSINVGGEFSLHVEFTPDGNAVVAEIQDLVHGDKIGLWEVSNGEQIGTFDFGYLLKFTVSPNGELIITSCDNASGSFVNIWNVQNKVNLRGMRVSWGYLPAIAFSPDGTFFAIGYRDGTVHIWGIKP